MKKRFTLELQKHPLKVSVTTCGTSNTPNTETTQSYENIYRNSKMLIYHQLLNEVLLQKCYQKQLNFCKLCLSEKFYRIKSLNDRNVPNKKSGLVNTCRHQSELLLKSFKKNQYSERSDTID